MHRSHVRARIIMHVRFQKPSRMAGGSAKRSDREFARFIRIALGSATKSENHLVLAHDLALIDEQQYQSLDKRTQIVQKMLFGFEEKLSRDASADRPLKQRAATASRERRAARSDIKNPLSENTQRAVKSIKSP